jgi:hypothetical protein
MSSPVPVECQPRWRAIDNARVRLRDGKVLTLHVRRSRTRRLNGASDHRSANRTDAERGGKRQQSGQSDKRKLATRVG